MKIKKNKIFLIALIIILIASFYLTGLYKELEFENIQSNLDRIQAYFKTSPYLVTLMFVGAYVLITSLSIPGAIVLTLLSGAIFGVFAGTLIVSISSCLGATIAFLMSRYLFRDAMMKKYDKRFKKFDEKFRKSGKSYLFTLRLIPISPFVVINIFMGLTTIRLWTYIWITFVGMIPGTFIYVFAGRKISEIESPSEILSPSIIIILSVIGLLPVLIKWVTSLTQTPGQNFGK